MSNPSTGFPSLHTWGIFKKISTMNGLEPMKIFHSLILLLFPVCLYADFYTEYVWYRVEEGRVLISVETLTDRKEVEAFLRRPKALEPEGKFHTYDYEAGSNGETRELQWTEEIAGQRIETKVVIHYPRGNTRGGAVPRVRLEVKVDGILRVQSHLGFDFATHHNCQRFEVDPENRKISTYVLKDIVPSQTDKPPEEMVLDYKDTQSRLEGSEGQLRVMEPGR